ncbi:MAG: MBL fold metallo-hydrolase [Planctomycetota bacterium]|nr:MBL fold metallo-hydrolase [Planctomycetota bacterium]
MARTIRDKATGPAGPRIEFHGAAQGVTGSMHILHLDQGPVVLDCGMFQGRRDEARKLNEVFPDSCRTLRAVLLSHAHIDHSGRIPGLVKKGFRGPIHATGATTDLCDVMLADAAHIQEEDARFWNERRARSPKEYIKPLYTLDDAKAAHRLFRSTQYNTPVEFADGATVTYYEAGHILGSACVLVSLTKPRPVRLLYTGDLGRFDIPILRDPICPMPEADYLITESTYAGRRHDAPSDMRRRLVTIIKETVRAGRKVIIPSFSVGRTQHLLYELANLRRQPAERQRHRRLQTPPRVLRRTGQQFLAGRGRPVRALLHPVRHGRGGVQGPQLPPRAVRHYRLQRHVRKRTHPPPPQEQHRRPPQRRGGGGLHGPAHPRAADRRTQGRTDHLRPPLPPALPGGSP